MVRLKNIKCPNCGATLSVYPSYKRAACEYCGSNFYVDLPESNGSPVIRQQYGDNPARISLIRDKGDYERSIWPPAAVPNHGRYLPGETISDLICFLSGVSYVTKKSYSIANGALWSNLDNSPLCDNYRHSSVFHRPLKEKQTWNSDHRKVMSELKDTFKALGISYEEIITTQKSDMFPYELRDFHRFKLTFPVIGPSYFRKHFEDVYLKYKRVKDYEVTDNIASVMCTDLASFKRYLDTKPIGFFFEVASRYVMWKGYGAAYRVENNITFHQVGMDNIKSDTLIKALQIAIIERVLKGTAVNGKPMFDIDSNVYWYPDSDSYYDAPYGKGFRFRYAESYVKEYRQW